MGKVIVLSVLILCTICPSVFAADINCSNSRGSFQLVSESYAGGTAPIPGMIIGYRRVSLYSQILEEDIVRQGGESPHFDVIVEFDPESYVLVKNGDSTRLWFGQQIIYVQDVHAYREDGQELLPDVNEISTTVICTLSQFFFL